VDPFLALADRLVGQADEVEAGQPGSDLALHLDRARLQPEIGYRPDECDHETPCKQRLVARFAGAVEWGGRAW
jgi:hypothetical protein